MRPRSARSPCAYRPAIAPTNSSRAAMLICLILSPAGEHRSGANQMRQYRSFREHIRRGNAEARVDQDEKLSPEARRKEGVARLKSRIWRPARPRKGPCFLAVAAGRIE